MCYILLLAMGVQCPLGGALVPTLTMALTDHDLNSGSHQAEFSKDN